MTNETIPPISRSSEQALCWGVTFRKIDERIAIGLGSRVIRSGAIANQDSQGISAFLPLMPFPVPLPHGKPSGY